MCILSCYFLVVVTRNDEHCLCDVDAVAVHQPEEVWQEIVPEFGNCSFGVVHGDFYFMSL